MNRWLEHLLPLLREAEKVVADDAEVNKQLQTKDAVCESAVGPAAEYTAQQIAQGMEVSLADLNLHQGGWSYRNQPIMVYDVNVLACDDAALRREFAKRIHLGPCCGALENPPQSGWISSDWSLLAGGEYQVCEYCLSWSNYRGFRSANTQKQRQIVNEFTFDTYLRDAGGDIFSHCLGEEACCYWQSGTEVQAFELTEGQGKCGVCDWPIADDQLFQLPAEVVIEANPSAVAGQGHGHCCVLCAQQQSDGVMYIDPEVLLQASRSRFHYWQAELGDGHAKPDWQQLGYILPLSWRTLLESLEPHVPSPELFVTFVGYHGEAVLAWPEFRRGIVARDEERHSLPPDWDFWTPEEALSGLG